MTEIWPTAAIKLRLQDLQDTKDALSALPKGSGFTEVCLSRYLVVRSAGYVETVRDDSAEHLASLHSHEMVVRRVRANLRSGLGASPEQLKTFVGTFDPVWSADLKSYLAEDDSRLSNRLGALVNARKKIAHGEGDNVTPARALEWALAAEEIGQWLLDRFNSTAPTP